MIRDSVEYLTFTLTDRDGEDLTADTVTVAIVARGTDLETATWLPATHVTGNQWRTTNPITWTEANYPASSYQAFAKVADSPETPIAGLGLLTIRR